MEQLKYIIIGYPESPSFTFAGDDILSMSGDFSVDMIGAELCTDVMEAEVSYNDTDGTLRALPWATTVYFYRGENLEGKMYSVSVTRIGKTVYRILTASAAGIMEYDKFYGGLYSGETFRTVVESIIGSNGLQPYAGVYSRLYREASAAGTRGLCMGAYGDEKYPEEDEDAAFLSATMSSKLSAKVKINGFSAPSNAVFAYVWQCSIMGVDTLHEYSLPKTEKYRYGLYMYVTRQSTDIPFPSFGEVFFVYGTTKISLGTPVSAEEAVYEIDVDPNAGTAVINGVTYTITLDSSLADVLCPIHVYGGGVTFKPVYASGERAVYSPIHNCDLEVYHYIIRDSAGNLQASYVGARDDIRGTINIYDCVSHKCLQNAPYSMVSPADLEPYDKLTYGENLLFNNRTDFQTDVLARLSYADGIDTIPIHGWMAIKTKREALQQLLFATGVILIKDDNGSVLFAAPSAVSSGDGNDDDIYDVGSEEQPDHVNAVTLTENTYTLDTVSEEETIYENNALSSGYYIAEFANAPAMQTGSSGLTCVCANCNAAIVTGQGTLTGRPYFRTTRELQREIANYPDGHMVSVPDATLVTLLNSESVLDRLAAYYGSAGRMRIDIALNGERCGLKYDRSSAFGEPFSGYLVRISKTITSIVRGACEFIQGYIPAQIGNSYENYVILTGSGTWTVPASVFEKETPRIHVVLIGGGYGGDSGYAGENGMQPGLSEGSEPAEGGAIGESGVGGKIFEITITAPAASYAYSCGQGGVGGAISYSHDSNNPGSPGGDTTISDGNQNYSSENGATRENGIWNTLSGQQYAGRMFRSRIPDIAALSAGGSGGYDSSESWGSQPHMGGDCQEWVMDTELAVWYGALNGDEYRSNGWVYARGGGGGGGGCGQNGERGSDASYSGGKYRSGNGGKGGDATEEPPKATSFNSNYYGFGGLGGGGGGGGGAGGWVLGAQGKTYVVGTGGNGGYGGRGGDGGDGCVLIYY